MVEVMICYVKGWQSILAVVLGGTIAIWCETALGGISVLMVVPSRYHAGCSDCHNVFQIFQMGVRVFICNGQWDTIAPNIGGCVWPKQGRTEMSPSRDPPYSPSLNVVHSSPVPP